MDTKQINEHRMSSIMSNRLYMIFKNRIQQASHFGIDGVEKAVNEFYRAFRDKVNTPDFTIGALMELADKIEGTEHEFGYPSHGYDGRVGGFRITDHDANSRAELDENKIRKAISEAIKKVVNEIGNTPKGQHKLGMLNQRMAKQGRDKDAENVAKYAKAEQDKAYNGDNFTTHEKAMKNGGKLANAYLHGRDVKKINEHNIRNMVVRCLKETIERYKG